ncbi:hypothetical protein [Pseudomonas sp. GM17]|uniref:hypothetical protein n=1 Tax=Pseudomonas sp. GM17 TaxID=1144323 RepID=UPI0012F691DD|nr:hypothetical protein [Pseudomonas sp. GM17]WIE52111.1 hypothetical protein PMI20_011075 [Pseudomonas sp. GM17]
MSLFEHEKLQKSLKSLCAGWPKRPRFSLTNPLADFSWTVTTPAGHHKTRKYTRALAGEGCRQWTAGNLQALHEKWLRAGRLRRYAGHAALKTGSECSFRNLKSDAIPAVPRLFALSTFARRLFLQTLEACKSALRLAWALKKA